MFDDRTKILAIIAAVTVLFALLSAFGLINIFPA